MSSARPALFRCHRPPASRRYPALTPVASSAFAALDFDLVRLRLLGLGGSIGAGLLCDSGVAVGRSFVDLAGLSGPNCRARRFAAGGSVVLPARRGRVVRWRGERILRRGYCCRRRRCCCRPARQNCRWPAARRISPARWAPWKDRLDANSDVTLTTGSLSRWTSLSISKDRASPRLREKYLVISIVYILVRAGVGGRKRPPFLPGGKICRPPTLAGRVNPRRLIASRQYGLY